MSTPFISPIKVYAHQSVMVDIMSEAKYFIKSVSHATSTTILIRVVTERLCGDFSRIAPLKREAQGENATQQSRSKGTCELRELVCLCDLLDTVPDAGKHISPEELEALEEIAAVTEAIKRSLSILAYGANSPQTLKIKLVKRGIAPGVALKAIEYLINNNYIRVESDAMRLAERCLNKRWGLTRILAYLKGRGFDEKTVFSVEESYADFDFSEPCEQLIRDGYLPLPTDLKAKSRMISSLTSMGYTISEIKTAIGRVMASEK